jgi:hypothetical protein
MNPAHPILNRRSVILVVNFVLHESFIIVVFIYSVRTQGGQLSWLYGVSHVLSFKVALTWVEKLGGIRSQQHVYFSINCVAGAEKVF